MDETTTTSEVRVATLNLWGRRGPWDESRSVLVEGFCELAPDLVAFQEAVGDIRPGASRAPFVMILIEVGCLYSSGE
jgi:hypothetical protein